MVLWSHVRRKQHTWEHFSQIASISKEKFATVGCRHRYMSRTENFFLGDKAHTSVRWKIRLWFHFEKQGSVRTWTQSDVVKLNAWQMKALRRSLHLPPTLIDRSIANQRVLNIWESHRFALTFFLLLVEKETHTFGHRLRTRLRWSQTSFVWIKHCPTKNWTQKTGAFRTSWLLQTLKRNFWDDWDRNTTMTNPSIKILSYKTQYKRHVAFA